MRYNLKAEIVDILMLLFKLSILLTTYLTAIEGVILQNTYQALHNVKIKSSGAVTEVMSEKFYCPFECLSEDCTLFEWVDGVCKLYGAPIWLDYTSVSINTLYSNTNLAALLNSTYRALLVGNGTAFMMTPSTPMSYDNTHALCASLSGNFKMVMPKTRAIYDAMTIINIIYPSWIHVDLKKFGSEILFGDGTSYDDSEVANVNVIKNGGKQASVFAIRLGTFNDIYLTDIYTAVCQSSK